MCEPCTCFVIPLPFMLKFFVLSSRFFVALGRLVLTVVMVLMSDSKQIIKQSIALRAKYRAENGSQPTMRVVAPLLVVPHPSNRGGVPVSSVRTKDLVATIAKEACDVAEAHSSAVAVEEQPEEVQLVAQHIMPWKTFQAFYEKGVASDGSMAKCGGGMTAVLGSLSHSHFNCGCRNILCGKPGCVCVWLLPVVTGIPTSRATAELPQSWTQMAIIQWTG